MPSIKQEFIDSLLQRSTAAPEDLVSVIGSFSELHREGAAYRTACPVCGSDHSLVVTPGKQIFKCWNCKDVSGKTPLAYLMNVQKMNYPEAIEWLASYYNLLVEYNESPKREQSVGKRTKASFCHAMLRESGLEAKDVMATVNDGDSRLQKPTFIPGTLTAKGDIDPQGDDAVILYYDLDGNQVEYTYDDGKVSLTRPYVRVRYQFPDDHLDKSKRPIKYRSPSKAPTFIYYPQHVRACYKSKLEIPTLFIQEGEKKAEKACKHGLPSVAVSGIQNLGYRKKQGESPVLPEELVKLIETCQVRQVVFLLDSDCFDLTKTIKADDPIDRRPRNFFYAVKNYKEYFQRLKNRQLYVEIYFGYVRKNEAGDKGVDDLLAHSLKGNEAELEQDIRTAMNEKDLAGKWVQLHKITTMPDSRLQEIWKLNNTKAFCMHYVDQLRNIPEFLINGSKMHFTEDGKLESVQPCEADEQFWEESEGAGGRKLYYFRYTGAELFLEHRGFYRMRKPTGDFDFVRVENSIVSIVRPHEIADFVRNFTKNELPRPILEMLYKGSSQYLGQSALTFLDYLPGEFEQPRRDQQRMYFRDAIWEIRSDGIVRHEYTQLHACIWRDQQLNFAPDLKPDLIEVFRKDGTYSYRITEDGKKCDFLSFLVNASNFTWRKEVTTPDERAENAQSLVAKLSAFGYLCVEAKDRSLAKAVIGMDGRLSEIGASNGRSGKSLFGEALRQVIKVMYFNGKNFSASGSDSFVWDGVDETVCCVFLDDVRRDFDFESLFGLVTGDWPVNPKGASRYIIPFGKSPKVYIATNHAVAGDGDSFEDRMWLLGFSDFYSVTHSPKDDFGILFDDWDDAQWSLFWNFVATCIRIYFRFGYVPSPGDRLRKRKLRLELGEEFIDWADKYYAEPGRINTRLVRKDIYDALIEYVGPNRRVYYSPTTFGKKIRKYCEFRDYIFNPQYWDPVRCCYTKLNKDGSPNDLDKVNGVEFYTLGDDQYASAPMLFGPEEDPAVALSSGSDDDDGPRFGKLTQWTK